MRGALEARGIEATGRLSSEAVGDIYLDGRVLVIRKITVEYRLEGELDDDQKETVERVLGFHAAKCPVARSITPCIEIETRLEYA